MTDKLAKKLKKPFKFLHHLGYVIFIISLLIPFTLKKFLKITINDGYYTYIFLIDAVSCFLLVPSNYLDVYEDRNNLQFQVSKFNPTAKLGYTLFFGVIYILVFFIVLLG